eukprot:1726493-Pleurochrysis_carterae.AAC.2
MPCQIPECAASVPKAVGAPLAGAVHREGEVRAQLADGEGGHVKVEAERRCRMQAQRHERRRRRPLRGGEADREP